MEAWTQSLLSRAWSLPGRSGGRVLHVGKTEVVRGLGNRAGQGPCSACDLPPGRRTRGGSGFTSSPFQLSPSVSRLRGGGGTHKEELRLFHILRTTWHTWLVSSKHKPVAAGRSTCPTCLPCMRVASLRISLEYMQGWHTPLTTSGCGPEGA